MSITSSGNRLSIAAALSTVSDSIAAVQEVCDAALARLAGRPDLVLAFVSPHHQEQAAEVARNIQDRTQARVSLGCTGESIAGMGREVEGGPAVALWAARLPGCTLHGFHLQ